MLRTIVWFIFFGISILITTPGLLKVKSLDKKGLMKEKELYVRKMSKWWSSSLLKLAGVNVIVHGEENLPKDRTVLFIGNHQGNFDIPIFISAIDFHKGFVSKAEMGKMPGVSKWMEEMHCIFMDRSNIRKSGEAIINGIKTLKAGHSLVIFPEGTRSKGDKMSNFKAGSFKLATKSKVPIVPVTISGSYKIMEINKHSWIKPATVDLYIHPMVETAGLSKEEEILLPSKIQEIVESKLPH